MDTLFNGRATARVAHIVAIFAYALVLGVADPAAAAAQRPDGMIRNCFVFDAKLRVSKLKPGCIARVSVAGKEHEIVINSKGFRGPEPSVRSKDLVRIAVLGSRIFAPFLPEESTPTAQLEVALNADTSRSGSLRFEVMNVAAPGQHAVRAALELAARIRGLEPDYVIYDFSSLDIIESYLESGSIEYVDDPGVPEGFRFINDAARATEWRDFAAIDAKEIGGFSQAKDVTSLLWSLGLNKEIALGRLIQPLSDALGFVAGAAPNPRRFLIALSPHPVSSTDAFRLMDTSWKSFFRMGALALNFKTTEIVRAMKKVGFRFSNIDRRFEGGLANGLLTNGVRAQYTVEGAKVWAAWAAQEIRSIHDELQKRGESF